MTSDATATQPTREVAALPGLPQTTTSYKAPDLFPRKQMGSSTSMSTSKHTEGVLSLPPEIIRLIFRALGERIFHFDRHYSPSRRILLASLVHSSWTLPAQEEALRAASRDDGFDIGSRYRARDWEGILDKMERYPTLAGQVKRVVLKGGGKDSKRAFLRILVNVRDLEVVDTGNGLQDLCWDDLGHSPVLRRLSILCSGTSQMLPSTFATPGLRSLTHLSFDCLSGYTPGIVPGYIPCIIPYLLSPSGSLISHLPSLTSLAWTEPSSWETEAATSFLSPCIPQLTHLELLATVDIHLDSVGNYWSKLLPLVNKLTSLKVSWEHYLGRTTWPIFIDNLSDSCRLAEFAVYDPDSQEREPLGDDDDDKVEVPYKATYEQLMKDLERAPFGTLRILRVFGESWDLQRLEEAKRLEELKGKGDIEKLCERREIQLEFYFPP